MQFTPLSAIPLDEILSCFNASFANYFVPINMTAEVFEFRKKATRVDLDQSVGVIDNGELVGFILIGVDQWNGKKTAHNSGTGVLPSHRGQQLTEKMYAHLIPQLRANGFEQSILEVIQGNNRAVEVYQRVGYEIVRGFNCFSGELSRTLKPIPSNYSIEKSTHFDWESFHSFWTFETGWDASKAAVEQNASAFQILTIQNSGEIVGYCLYTASGSIAQIAVARAHRNKGLGKHLLKTIQEEAGALKINNVQSDQWATLSFFQKAGLKNPVNQYEMLMSL